jgi:hypothetical protein
MSVDWQEIERQIAIVTRPTAAGLPHISRCGTGKRREIWG